MKLFFSRSVLISLLIFSVLSLGATSKPDPAPEKEKISLTPVSESAAFQEYLQKPKTNLAKLIFGLNYFRNAPVMIQYDGVEYPPQFAYPLGLAYLLTHYHDEKPESWIKKNCYRSPTANQIIYFKFNDGVFRPARDVFIEIYAELEKAEQAAVPKGL